VADAQQDVTERVRAHYGKQDYGARILEALRATGADLQTVTADDIAQATHFTRGKAPVLDLARLGGLEAGMRVLDVGSGLGGPARTLATDLGCQVTGIELTDAFYQAAVMLTELTGLSDQVQFVYGNAIEMPFPDGHFDAVMMTQVAMLVEDKARLFGQIHRVLRPGGRFVLQDFAAGPVTSLLYPAGFATDPSTVFLVPPVELRTLLSRTGFEEQVWIDQTAALLALPPLTAAPTGGMPTAAQLLLGADLDVTTRTVRRNYEDGRLKLYRGVFARP